MICHVCEQQAIGQCKKCGKFYCKQHGDVTCMVCNEALQKKPLRPASDFDVRLPEYGGPRHTGAPVYAGPRCYNCSQAASAACAKCGQFYCPAHRGGTSPFDYSRGFWWQGDRVLCDDCRSSIDRSGMIQLVIGAVTLLILLGALIMAAMMM